VVCKRLQREGLGERLVMVTDLSKDRRRLSSLYETRLQPYKQTVTWTTHGKDRENRSRSHSPTGRELNARQAALCTRDDLSGLTYRELMAKLIALEDGAEVICDSLELRESFGSMDAESVSEVIESCASSPVYGASRV